LSLNSYLTFDGDCREAFEFYRSILGGAFAAFHSFSGGGRPRDLVRQLRHQLDDQPPAATGLRRE
jgi:uncharacterized glyoxalase superfamily protein PhnB